MLRGAGGTGRPEVARPHSPAFLGRGKEMPHTASGTQRQGARWDSSAWLGCLTEGPVCRAWVGWASDEAGKLVRKVCVFVMSSPPGLGSVAAGGSGGYHAK